MLVFLAALIFLGGLISIALFYFGAKRDVASANYLNLISDSYVEWNNIDPVPVRLRDLAQQERSFEGVILAVLIDSTPRHQEAQLEYLLGLESQHLYSSTLEARAYTGRLHPKYFLPLLELACPKLPSLSEARFETFTEAIKSLIEEDGMVSLLEYSVYVFVRKYRTGLAKQGLEVEMEAQSVGSAIETLQQAMKEHRFSHFEIEKSVRTLKNSSRDVRVDTLISLFSEAAEDGRVDVFESQLFVTLCYALDLKVKDILRDTAEELT